MQEGEEDEDEEEEEKAVLGAPKERKRELK